MKRWLRRGICMLQCMGLVFQILPVARGAEDMAWEINGWEAMADQSGFENCGSLFDGNTTGSRTFRNGSWITFRCPEGIGALYLIFDIEYGPYTVMNADTGESRTFGENGFLHEFLDLAAAFGTSPQTITITFDAGDVKLNEIYLFSPGEVPVFVQKWEPPKEGKTDLILFSTHGDDEQLFFAGLLPYYARERDLEVLVAYLTNHRNCGTLRCHEMLDGLWAVGVTTYPVFGGFGDYYSCSKEQALKTHEKNGEFRQEILGYIVQQLRRYKPQVVVGHDLNGGEYGHGQHMMYANLLREGLESSRDAAQYPEQVAQWGTWDVPKAYFHLWQENTVTMDWDKPLEAFGGMTAFQVTQQLGFPKHKSQIWGFDWYINRVNCAADIPKYSPCQYGLYRSTVGSDTGKQDFFENLTSYAEQARQEAIAINRENAIIARETAMKAAQQRQHQAEELSEQRQARLQAEAAARKAQKVRLTVVLILVMLVLMSTAAAFWRGRKRRK